MTRKHIYNGEEVEIEWERLSQEDEAGDGYCFMYGAQGESEDGRKWGATWTECCGEVEIEDVDLAENF